MHSLILAAEAADHSDMAGDDFMTIALVMLGIMMLIAAIATWRVTPKGEHH